MPTYEYVCRSCEHEFEVFQSMTEGPKRKCPECGKNALERKIGTGAAVLFKGSGFYQTDYRSESYKKAAEAEKKPAETKTDTSAATPTEKGTAEKKPAEGGTKAGTAAKKTRKAAKPT
jgi:putative FmdB family regulatory protein